MKAGNAKVLIVTNGQLSRNPRVWKEAQTLGQAGYAVTVLMVRNHAAGERNDVGLMGNASFRREVVDLLPGFSAGPGRLLARRAARWLAASLGVRLGLPTIHALGPASALLSRARAFPADLTIVHNEVPHWVGVRLLAQGRRVAADFEDWHSEDLLPANRAHRPLKILRAVERSLLQQAAYTSTTSEALADALQERNGGRRPLVLTNSFPLQTDPRSGPPGKPPAIFWFSQTLGPGRGLESFVAAWGRTRLPSRLVLLGDPQGAMGDGLRAQVPAGRRQDLVFLKPVPPEELPGLIAKHDIGLALEQSDIPSRDLTITNKILQYLNAGLVVLASDTKGQREVIARDPAVGLIADFRDSGAAASAVDRLLSDEAALGARQAAARRLAEQFYCWEHESPRLLDAVAAAISSR